MELISPETAAADLGISAETVRRWCRRGVIEGAKRHGKQWRFTRSQLAAALERLSATQNDKRVQSGPALALGVC